MRPYVIIFTTTSIDGRLATKTGYSELSCPHDKVRQHILRAEVDALMVGANTIRVDDPKLELKYARGRSPLRVIISTKAELGPERRIFKGGNLVVYAISPSQVTIDELASRGVPIRLFNGRVCEVMNDLNVSFGVNKVMVEGGGKLIWSIIRDNCFDELRVTISPKIFGNGRSLVEGEGFSGPEAPILQLLDSKLCECGNEVVLKYKNRASSRL